MHRKIQAKSAQKLQKLENHRLSINEDKMKRNERKNDEKSKKTFKNKVKQTL